MKQSAHNLTLPCLPSDIKVINTIKKVFKETGFQQHAVLKKLGDASLSGIKGSDIPELLYRTREQTPLDVLIRLFLMEVPVPYARVQDVIPNDAVTAMVQVGMLYEEDNNLISRVKIIPFQDFFTCFDSAKILQSSMREEYVMGIGASTITLANLTVRSHARNTLDLGAGCGFHAILATAHSDNVVALDLNARAVSYTEFNSQLNGLTTIQSVTGDLFEPIKGQKFDLIVSNPPFVISPETSYIYRDGGMPGDTLIEKIVKNAPSFLNEGGYCQILCNWAEIQGVAWQDRLENWFADLGCDVWILRSESRDALTYASTWIRHTEKAEQANYEERFNRWINYFAEEKISSVGAGCIIMRKRKNVVNWFAAENAPTKINSPCGDQIIRGFALRDFLNSLPDDEALLKTVLLPAPELVLEKVSTPKPEGWNDSKFLIRLQCAIPYEGRIEAAMADFIRDTSNGRPLKKHLKKMARTAKQNPEDMRESFCQMVKNLIEKGLLLPREVFT